MPKLGTCLRQPTNSADFGIGVGGVRGLHSPAACSIRPGEGLIPAVYQKDGGAGRRATLRRDQPEHIFGREIRCS